MKLDTLVERAKRLASFFLINWKQAVATLVVAVVMVVVAVSCQGSLTANGQSIEWNIGEVKT